MLTSATPYTQYLGFGRSAQNYISTQSKMKQYKKDYICININKSKNEYYFIYDVFGEITKDIWRLNTNNTIERALKTKKQRSK